MLEKNYQPTPEQLQRWQELDELEKYAFAGKPVSKEQFIRDYNSIVDGSLIAKHLENIRKRKQQLLEELADLEEHEAWVVQQMEENKNKKKQ